MAKPKTVVAMSGGVDSTVAALLMQRAGYEIVGMTGKFLPDECSDASNACCTAESARDARRACDLLGAPHFTVNLVDEFRESVTSKYFAGYQQGLTPNPCVDCNRYVKFDLFFRLAAASDAEHIATGHYARIEPDESGELRLMRGLDRNKDQSYFLAVLPREKLGRIHFPVGNLMKDKVRALADEIGFRNARRPESQDICFVSKGLSFEALAARAGVSVSEPRQGPIYDEAGNVRGEHGGIESFTVGQRRGMRVGFCGRVFVNEIDPAGNAIRVGPRDAKPISKLRLKSLNILAPDLLDRQAEITWQLRYRSKPVPAKLELETRAAAADLLRFSEPQYLIAPGQWAVGYLGDVVVGCGEIFAPE